MVGSGDSTPALVGERLYVFTRQGDDEVVTCLEAATGEQVWRQSYAAQAVSGAARRHPGPRSSPAVAEGKVVVLGVGGVLTCLDAASGEVVWTNEEFSKIVPKFFTSASPIIVDGMAIAHLGRAGNGAIMALDLATGEEKWRWAGEGPGYDSPVLLTVGETKMLVTLTEKSVVGVDVADGKLLWQIPFPARRMAYNAATPIVEGQTVIFTGQGRGAKAVRIQKTADGFAAEQVWSNPDLAPQFNTPVLKNGLLFGLSEKGVLYCLDAEDGKTAWTDTVKRGGSFAAILDAGPVLVALPSTSELIVYEPSGEAFEEVASYKVAETPTYAHPVLADGDIYVKDRDAVTMWAID
jgi:outer membrane protein assembly factor BamB